MLLTKLCVEQPQKVLFTRYTMVSAHLSIVPEFKEKIDLLNASHLFEVNKNEIINKYAESTITFKGIKTSSGEQTASLKSLQGITTWVLDEAEELQDENVFDKIDLSIRSNQLQNRVILIMNPATKEHWIYQRFFESKGVSEGYNGVVGDTTYIHTTYLENYNNLNSSFLLQVDAIKRSNPDKYNHVILGGWLKKAEGVIFTNWEIGEFNNDIPSVFGQDYGFSIDPTTLVNVAIDKSKKIIYVNECFYQQGLTTSEIEQLDKRYASSGLIVGDSAEPRLNEELRRKGVNIKDTVKIPVNTGIAMIQDFKLVVTPTSLNLIKELNNYQWSDRKSETPIDKHNHAIDSLRYSVVYQLDKKDFKINKPMGFGVTRK